MNCGIATITVCLLQKLWHGHTDCLSFTEVKRRLATLVLGSLQCTTRVSDGFAPALVD